MNIDFDLKCTTGGFALEYPINECLRNIGGGGGGGVGPTGPTGNNGLVVCANPPLQISLAPACVEITPTNMCGAILQSIGGAWNIYRSPGITEVTVGAGGPNTPPGANYPNVQTALTNSGNTNCRFIRVTDNGVVDGAISSAGPGPARPLLIYVDPGVTWNVASIDAAGVPLVLKGSGDTSSIIISGQITGILSLTVMDLNLTFRGFVGGNVSVRDSVLSVNTNSLAAAVTNLNISNTQITLNGVAISTTPSNIKLTRVTVGGTPAAIMLDGYTLAEVDEFTYNGTSNTGLVLREGRFSEIRDVGGLLDIRIATTLPTIFHREVNGFYGGRNIVSHTGLTTDILNNVILRGVQCQQMLLLTTTIWRDCIWDDIQITNPGGIIYTIVGTYENCQMSNVRTPTNTTWFFFSPLVPPTLNHDIQMNNWITGPITSGSGQSGEWMNITIDGLFCESLNLTGAQGVTNGYYHNIVCNGDCVFATNPAAITNSTLSNVTVTGNLTVGSPNAGNVNVSNFSVTGTLSAATDSCQYSNGYCGTLSFGTSDRNEYSNVTVNNPCTIPGQPPMTLLVGNKFSNCNFNQSLTVNGDSNEFANCSICREAVGFLVVVGNRNTFTGIGDQFADLSGGLAVITVSGNENFFSNLFMPGSNGGAINTFTVSGNHNEFCNIHLGTGNLPTDVGAFGSQTGSLSTSDVILDGVNNRYANLRILQKENIFTTTLGVDSPSFSTITISGQFHHFTNCVFYRNNTDYPLALTGPNNQVSFPNQYVLVSATNCEFSNIRIGDNTTVPIQAQVLLNTSNHNRYSNSHFQGPITLPLLADNNQFDNCIFFPNAPIAPLPPAFPLFTLSVIDVSGSGNVFSACRIVDSQQRTAVAPVDLNSMVVTGSQTTISDCSLEIPPTVVPVAGFRDLNISVVASVGQSVTGNRWAATPYGFPTTIFTGVGPTTSMITSNLVDGALPTVTSGISALNFTV